LQWVVAGESWMMHSIADVDSELANRFVPKRYNESAMCFSAGHAS